MNIELDEIDECATNDHDCDSNATCTDTLESYTCACNLGAEGFPGFTGDGWNDPDGKMPFGEGTGCDGKKTFMFI